MTAENLENKGCLQMDSAEHEEYAKAQRTFRQIWKERDSTQPELLEKILSRRNMVRAYKRVKANKGAPGIDGMTVEEAGDYLNKNYHELVQRIKKGKYTPQPVKRVELPKPEGGVRKLGIPTVIDRTLQQAMNRCFRRTASGTDRKEVPRMQSSKSRNMQKRDIPMRQSWI